MAAIPVLLAGTTGAGGQDHQSAMWAPALAEAGFAPVGLWSPPDAGDAQSESAARLARDLEVPLRTDEEPSVPVGAAVVACLRGDRRAQLLATAGEDVAVLVDKPTLDATAQLEAQLAGSATRRLLSGHHFASHPSFLRAAAAVRDGEIGLLRAVMIDLVVAAGDGVSPEGDLRNIGVHAADLMLRLTGPAELTVGTAALEPGAVTFLAQTDRDVVLSGHVSRTASGTGTLLARMRVVGTHGHVDVDLTRPALTVRTASATVQAGYGTGSVTGRLRELHRLAEGGRTGETAASWLAVSRLLDAIAESSASGDAITVEKQS
ncbi:hypothetical protein [Microbacterium sp.]|uniref:hypothetical protein n=1 Tax=Microbacterium sp. TaxID=51671 RepID=UPI0033402707